MSNSEENMETYEYHADSSREMVIDESAVYEENIENEYYADSSRDMVIDESAEISDCVDEAQKEPSTIANPVESNIIVQDYSSHETCTQIPITETLSAENLQVNDDQTETISDENEISERIEETESTSHENEGQSEYNESTEVPENSEEVQTTPIIASTEAASLTSQSVPSPEACSQVQDAETNTQGKSSPQTEVSTDQHETDEKTESESINHKNEEQLKVQNEIQTIQMCIRSGCINPAINNPEWEQEFCSNDCVVIHCRNVFMAWVKANEVISQ